MAPRYVIIPLTNKATWENEKTRPLVQERARTAEEQERYDQLLANFVGNGIHCHLTNAWQSVNKQEPVRTSLDAWGGTQYKIA